MDNSRRKKRQFNTGAYEAREKEHFKFPMDMDDTEDYSPDVNESDGERSEDDHFTRRNKHGHHYRGDKYQDEEKSSYTIKKAREIPSAVHGTNQKEHRTEILKQENFSDDMYTDEDNISSVIIRDIVRDRNRRKKKEIERARREAVRLEREEERYQDPYNLKSSKHVLSDKQRGGEVEDQVSGNEPVKSESPPEDTENIHEKRRGPSLSLPNMNMLGPLQKTGYDKMDEALGNSIIKAFELNGMPAHIHTYKSNGIIGRFEMKLDRNFRIGHVPKLKQYLQPYLPGHDFRVVAPIIGTSNIGIEIPLTSQEPVPFSTLFDKSSLKLRKNDFKYVLGKTVDDQIFGFELPKSGHILIYGGTDEYAKNVIDQFFVSMFMNHTPYDFKMYFVTDRKKYSDYQHLPYLFGSEGDIADKSVLKDVYDELIERQNQFRRAHVKNINSFNKRVNHDAKKNRLAVVIDDFCALYENDNAEAVKMIVQLLKNGKPLGIHLIIRHSLTDVKMRFDLLNMMQTRISFYDGEETVVEGSSEITAGNDMLVQIPTSNRPLRINAGTLMPEVKQRIFDHMKLYNP